MSQSMNYKIALLAGLAVLLVASVPAFAQQIPPQMNPTPGWASTPAQLEATKKAALDFAFLTGDAKIALADPTYIQHNPVQHKRAQVEGTSDFESFKKTFLAQPAAPAGGGGRGAAAGPQPCRQGIAPRSCWCSATSSPSFTRSTYRTRRPRPARSTKRLRLTRTE